MILQSITFTCLLAAINAVKIEFSDGLCLLGSKKNSSSITRGDCESKFSDWNVQPNGDIFDFKGRCFLIGKENIKKTACHKIHVRFNKYNGIYKTNQKTGESKCMVLKEDEIAWKNCVLENGIYWA